MFGMPVGLIVDLVIGAIVIAALYGLVHSVDATLRHHYVDPVVAVEEKKVTAANTDRDTALRANDSLKEDNDLITMKVTACNKRVDSLGAIAKAAQAEAHAAVQAQLMAGRASKAKEDASRVAAATKPATPPTEKEACDHVKLVAAEYARDALGLTKQAD